MKAWSRITDYVAALLLALVALVAGYVIGSIRGAHLASLRWRILHASFAYGVADAMRTGKSDIVLPDSPGVAHSVYQGVAGDPWLHERLLIPVVEWGESPAVSFGVGNAERHLAERVGQFLSETEKTSNYAVEPTSGPTGARSSP